MRSHGDAAVRAASSPAGPTITVRFRFFARYAEVLGVDAATVPVPPPATVAHAVAALRRHLSRGHLLPEHPLVAMKQRHVLGTEQVQEGDELALLPPLAGG